ncbi:MAG: carboxylating nicotinate-nucleotide diphosphorylase [Alteromonadaceae bacterium]|nr:carboxylating nicotinate-nucleotide diphosphorylase [Alteromonadaceae bacterium]
MNHTPTFATLLADEIRTSVLFNLAQDLGVPSNKLFADGVGCISLHTLLARDVTASLIEPEKDITANLITKEDCVFVGKEWVEQTFKAVSQDVAIDWHVKDGDKCTSGDLIATFSGNARAILIAERTAMNFAQTLSATATTVAYFVNLMGESKTRLLDTRKTLPGMRYGQKYAVTLGGGVNHRVGLYDRFLIKENHIMACGSIAAAVDKAKSLNQDILVEVEVESLDELTQAINAGVDIVMLDNFDIAQIEAAVALNNGAVKLEVSGNVDETTLAQLAQTNVDFISSGAITKHVKAVDLSLRVQL